MVNSILHRHPNLILTVILMLFAALAEPSIAQDVNNSGTLTIGGAFTVNTFNNSGSVSVPGSSILNVKSGFSQTSGATKLDGILNAPGPGVNIQGGTLYGSGLVNGNVTMAGTMSPGDAPGIFTINGNYTQTSTGILDETVGSFNGNTGSLLRVNGIADLHGTLSLSLLNGYDPTVGDSFTLMTFFQEDGSFNTINGLNLGNNEFLDLFYDPHDIRVEVKSNAVSTPEPSVLTLLLAGLALSFACLKFNR